MRTEGRSENALVIDRIDAHDSRRPVTPAANSSTPRLNRRAGVLLLLAAGAALLGWGAVPWVSGSANLPGSTLEKISSSGGQAAPMIPSLGLVLLAAAVALALARRIGVIITCLITGAAGKIGRA